MVALTYASFGGISSVSVSPEHPGSVRSRDGNGTQRMSFRCDPTKPFTGKIHVQASLDDPNLPTEERTWFDIAEMVIDNEGGTWSYQAEGEYACLRIACKDGNYWSAAHGELARTVATNGTISIDGISINLNAGDDAAAVAATINADSNIIASGTIVADLVQSTKLRIYKTTGATLEVADVTNTPLVDLGIVPGSYRGGVILAIKLLR